MGSIFVTGKSYGTPREEDVQADLGIIESQDRFGEVLLTVSAVGGGVALLAKAAAWVNKVLFRRKYHGNFEEE